MGARFQNWFQRNIWNPYDLNGTSAWSNIFGNLDNYSEERVSERRAHGLATAYSCINVRAQTVSALPINIIREKKGGDKEVITDHAAYYPLVHEPNDYMTSANLFMTSMIHSDSWGNSIIGINRDGMMRPESFDLIQPDEWAVSVEKGKAFYKIRGETYSSRDVLHFRWFSYDGLMGISPIRLNQSTFGKAFKADRFSTTSMGMKPPGILTYKGVLNPTQQAANQKSWKEDLAAGRTPVMSGDWDYKHIMISPGEAEYLGTEDMTDQRIAGIFRVPPVFLQNYQRATWKNAEESDLIFTKHTIVPIIRVIEQECNMKLFTEREKSTHSFKFNLNGLLRGDSAARAAFYTAMRNVGGMDANEIRDKEDMNKYEGGDIKTLQSANCPADMLREFYSSKVAPTAEATTSPVQSKNLNGHYAHQNGN